MSNIDIGTISGKFVIDASGLGVALNAARAQLKQFGADVGSAFDTANASMKRQTGSIQQWKAQQDAAAAAVKKTTNSLNEQNKAVKESTANIAAQMRNVSAMRAAAAEMAAAGRALTAMLVKTVDTGKDWNLHLTQIQNNTGQTTAQMAAMRTEVEHLGTTFGGNMTKIADGYMHAINMFHDFRAAQALTVAGAKAAIATGGDESETINGLAKVMKEWNIPMSQVNQTMNGLLVSTQRANSTLPEMMEHTNRLRAVYAGLNIPLSQVMALFQTLTQHGFNPAQAETQLLNFANSIIKPRKEAQDLLAVLGTVDPKLKEAFSLRGISAQPLSVLIKEIQEDAVKLGKDPLQAIQLLFNGLRALPGALSMSGVGFKDLVKNEAESHAVFTRTNELTVAVNRSQNELAVSGQRLSNEFTVVAGGVARDLTPAIQSLIRHIGDLYKGFITLSPVTRGFIEWGVIAAAGLLTVGARVLGLAATFYQLRTAILAAQAAGNAGPITGLLAKILGGGATGLALPAAGVAAMVYESIPKNTSDPNIQYFGALGGPHGAAQYGDLRARIVAENKRGPLGPAKVDLGDIARINTDNLYNIQSELDRGGYDPARGKKLVSDRDQILSWMKSNKIAMPVGFGDKSATGGESLQEFIKRRAKEDKAAAAEAKKAAREAAKQVKEDARDAESTAEDTKKTIDDAKEKLFELSNPTEAQTARHQLNRQMKEFKEGHVPMDLQQQYYKAASDDINQKELSAKTFGSEIETNASEIKAGILSNISSIFNEIDQAFTADAMDSAKKNAEAMKAYAKDFGPMISKAMSNLGLSAAFIDPGTAKRSQGGDSPDRVIADIDRLKDAAKIANSAIFANLMETTSKVYEFDYEQGNIAGENYRRFLEYKLSLTQNYSDEWMTIQKEIKRVEDDLNKSSTEGVKKAAKEKNQTLKEMLKDLQRSTTNVLAGLFDDLLSGHKNPFKAFLDAFKSMLIRMAAELAASEVVKLIAGLFNHNQKKPESTQASSSAGGAAGGAAGAGIGGWLGDASGIASLIPGGQWTANMLGAVGKVGGFLSHIFHFADGGYVPGPIGAPQPAIVHGGELVLNPAQQRAAGGGMHFHGDMHFHGVRDIGNFQRQLADFIRYQSPTRQGSG